MAPLVTCVSGVSPGNQNGSCDQKRGQVRTPTVNLFCSSDVQGQLISVFVPWLCVELSILNTHAGVWGWYFAWLCHFLGRALIFPDGQWVLVWAG